MAPPPPVNVLETAVGVIGGNNPQVFTILTVHAAGRSAAESSSREHRPFQLEAEHDVQVVRRLVGFDPDEGGANVVDGKAPIIIAHAGQGAGEDLPRSGEEPFPE